jgi:glycosyltransferase involved in cell wall biosynthesis
MPVLSVVIPTHHRNDSLAAALASFESQDLDRSMFEVCVVSNLDDAGARRICELSRERGLDVHYLVAGARGVNRSRNLGIEASNGDILFFLDDDCRLTEIEHLSRLLAVFSTEPTLGLRGGPYLSKPDASRTTKSYNSFVNAWIRGRARDRSLFAGGNLAVRREVVGNVRFDESIEYGGSEISFQVSLLATGVLAKWDEQAGVRHDVEATAFEIARKAWRQGRAKADWDGSSGLRSLVRLTDDGVGNFLFGLCFGVISRAAWLSSKIARGFAARQEGRVLEHEPRLTPSLREDASAQVRP